MSKHRRWVSAASFFLICIAARLGAQSFGPVQIGTELDITTSMGPSSSPAVGHDSHGHFLVVWRTQTVSGDSISASFVQAAGLVIEAFPPFTVKAAVAGVTVSAPAVAMDAAGRFTIVWGEARASEGCVRVARYGAGHRFLTSPTLADCEPAVVGAVEAPQVAADANAGGDVGVVWSRTANVGQHTLLLRTISPTGVLRPTSTVESQAGSDPRPRLAVGGGQVWVTWQDVGAGASSSLLRRFDITDASVAPKSPLPDRLANNPVLAASRSGQFAAAWSEGGASAGFSDVLGQMFLLNGAKRPRGDLAPIDYDALIPDGRVFRPAIASDRVGGVALVWESDHYDEDGTAIVGRMYNALGDPQSSIFIVNSTGAGSQKNPAVTLADDGQFLVAWETPPNGAATVQNVYLALFRMPHEDDPCVYRGNTFLCELVGGGILAAPIVFGSGRQNGDTPLLGDLDGDGRADPCLRRGGAFLCDLNHDGGKAEQRIVFGAPGLPAFLGDVDGNGTADPCVRDGRTFLCDTTHNGGSAEVSEVFGLATDMPLLGDVDGDGRADFCVYRASTKTLLCDTAHDGTRGLIYHVNTLSGDRAMLGDVDGDGRADFCVQRGTLLLCDTRHDATGLNPRNLTTRPGDWLLLGNVDGM